MSRAIDLHTFRCRYTQWENTNNKIHSACLTVHSDPHLISEETQCLGAALSSPLVVGDVQVCVDGQQSLLQEHDPLTLLVLRLVEDGLHLLHVARGVAVHLLQDLLVAGADLRTRIH